MPNASASATSASCARPIARRRARSPIAASAEPENVFVAKGGELEETGGRKCLCNCLLADIGMPQLLKDGSEEPGLVTTGDDLASVPALPGGTQQLSCN